jgi:ketosteroid isomerase-like protein
MEEEPRLESDEQEVLGANRAFYQALQSLDLERMDELWLHEDWVKCLHPGWELRIGWEEVYESWANIFHSTTRMQVTISRPLVRAIGDTAWVSCVASVTTSYEGGFSTAMVETTNIFVRHSGQWRMVHHHTSPLPGRVPSGTSRAVQ